ncbi:putative amino-acid metabolite efflux pump [Sporomusa carbonis]|uniref:DMT family transporter n=1 Tax=Sporomusa carbonis TaxID=3076075 RepID=UPI003A7107D3
MHKTSLIYLALTSVALLWGTSFAAAKIGMYELSPINLVIFRFIIASLVFAGILTTMDRNNTIERKDIPKFIILGFLAITSYFCIQYTGLTYTTTINAALIIATSPISTALMGAAFGWEKISASSYTGILLAFAGVSLIITNGQLTGLFQLTTLRGDFMLMVNALVWAGFTLYGKNILQKYRPFTAMAYIHILGTIMLLPLAFIPTELTPLPFIQQVMTISWSTAGTALYLAILCSVYGYYMWYTGVGHIGPVRTAVFSYLNPLFAIITGIWLLGERLTPYTIGGGIMVIAGVYLTNKFKQSEPNHAKHTLRSN